MIIHPYYDLRTFQTLCTSCPDEAVWHTWRKTGSRSCWGHCLPLRPLLLHYAETEENKQWAMMRFVSIIWAIELDGALTFKCSLNSSSNLRPHILVPPFPVPGWFHQNREKWESVWILTFIPFIKNATTVLYTCWVSSLNHEAFNISVEDAAVVKPTGTQGKKVLEKTLKTTTC